MRPGFLHSGIGVGGYWATRGLLRLVPIGLNVVTIWSADVSRETLSLDPAF
jgi:hypothetical protein